MRVGRVNPGIATPGHSGDQEIRQGELVPLGGEVPSKIRRRPPIVPAGLDVMRELQPRRNPIRLILAPKAQEDLGDNGPNQRYTICIEQIVNGDFLR